MAEEANVAEEAQTQETEGSGLRARLEDALAENRALKADKRDGILEGLGLDPASGMGLVLSEQFDEGKLTLDNLASTAVEKYGVVPPTPAEPQHPQAAAIQNGQQAVDMIGGQAGSVPLAPTRDERRQKAEAEGDYKTTMAMKGDEVASWFGGRQ